MPPSPRRITPAAKRGTPAERAVEFHAEQQRLKQEAADRREQRETAGDGASRRRGAPRAT